MYNLLVVYDKDAWRNAEAVFAEDRFLEHTDGQLAARFDRLSEETKRELMKLPCLFACEYGTEEPARVGWIKAVERRGSQIRITPVLDPEIAPLSQETLKKFEWELGIKKMEMTRTHWAVKEQDLIAVIGRITNGDTRQSERPYTLPGHALGSAAATHVGSPHTEARARENEHQYRFVRSLGEGLHGKTCLYDDEKLHRRVAVKFLLDGAGAYVDLLEQVRALARVEDPNVVRVYHYDTLFHPDTAKPAGAVLMEFIDGVPLATLINGGIGAGDAEAIGRGIVSGVAAIHKNNLVHTDLHGNVLVAQGRNAKIIDLFYRGTLRSQRTWSREAQVQQDLLDVGQMLGTLAHCAATNFDAVSAFRERVRRPLPLQELLLAFVATLEPAVVSNGATGKKFGIGRALTRATLATSAAATPVRQLSPIAHGGRSGPPPIEVRTLFEGLSEHASRLLALARDDPDGTILIATTDDGLTISTNGNDIVETVPRLRAAWKKALAELQRRGLVSDTGDGEMFEITADGYELLKPK